MAQQHGFELSAMDGHDVHSVEIQLAIPGFTNSTGFNECSILFTAVTFLRCSIRSFKVSPQALCVMRIKMIWVLR